MGTYVPVTSQGSAYGRFRRALDRRNTLQALSAAAELPHVSLTEALELVLLLADEEDDRRFRRASVRWHSRYCREVPEVEPAEAQAVLGLVLMLGGPRRAQASHALAQLLDRRELPRAAETLASVPAPSAAASATRRTSAEQ
jgi:hypothetical protein